MSNLSKILIISGLLLVLAGGLVWLLPQVPGLDRLGSLPGDIRLEGKRYRVYFPWVTCLILSLALTLASYLFRRFF